MDLRSGLDSIAFPALMAGPAAELMALQRQLDATQYWPPDRMRAAQAAQLRQLLPHAATLPFHAARLRQAGLLPLPADDAELFAAWRRLPPLTRRDLQDHGPALHATPPPPHGPVAEIASGGSTGEPVRVRKTALEGMLFRALLIRDEIWNREDMTGTIARMRGIPPGFTAEQTARARTADGLILPDWGPPVAQIWRTGRVALQDSIVPLATQAGFIARLRPDYLFMFPSSLRPLLLHCRDHGLTFPSLRSVWTLSEVVDPDLRALCREILGVRIVDSYSAAECGYIALQCPQTDAYHVQSETALVEVVDTNGNPCAPGETGRVLVTPLHNFAQPLLRYEIGDEAEVGGAEPGPPCPCGRHLPVLARIHGRVLDQMVYPDGERRRTAIQHYALSRIAKLRQFQLIQRTRTQVDMRLVVARPLDPAEEEAIRAALADSFAPGTSFALHYVDEIPRTSAGKLRTFICEAT